MAKKRNILTMYQKGIWKQVKAGAIIKRFKKMNDVEAWRMTTQNASVIGWVKDSCMAKLKRLNRVCITNNGWQKNPNWHGNKNISKQSK